MIWSVRQVCQAEAIFSQIDVYEDYFLRYGPQWRDVFDPLKDALFRHHSGIAHTFGLVLDPRDLRFMAGPRHPKAPVRTVGAKWAPRTRRVELLGGQNDGVMTNVPRLRERFVVPLQGPPVWDLWRPDDMGPEELEQTSEAYDFYGWHESRRIWLYKWVGKKPTG